MNKLTEESKKSLRTYIRWNLIFIGLGTALLAGGQLSGSSNVSSFGVAFIFTGVMNCLRRYFALRTMTPEQLAEEEKQAHIANDERAQQVALRACKAVTDVMLPTLAVTAVLQWMIVGKAAALPMLGMTVLSVATYLIAYRVYDKKLRGGKSHGKA